MSDRRAEYVAPQGTDELPVERARRPIRTLNRVDLRMRFGRWKLVKDDANHWHYERRYQFIPARWWR